MIFIMIFIMADRRQINIKCAFFVGRNTWMIVWIGPIFRGWNIIGLFIMRGGIDDVSDMCIVFLNILIFVWWRDMLIILFHVRNVMVIMLWLWLLLL